MFHHLIRILFLTLVLPGLSFSAPHQTTYQEVMTVSKSVFLSQFKISFAGEFCHEQSPFMKCFDVEQKRCTEFLDSKIEPCSNQLKLPRRIRLDLQGSKVGELLGQCLGTTFIQKHNSRKIVNDYCERRSQWAARIQ